MKSCLVWRMPCDSQTSSSRITWELTVWPSFLLSSALFAEVQLFSRNWWSHLCVSSHPRAFTLAISSLEYPPPSLLSFAPFIPIYLSCFSAHLTPSRQSSPWCSRRVKLPAFFSHCLVSLLPSTYHSHCFSFVEDHWMTSSSQTIISPRKGFVSHSFHPGSPPPSALPGTQ